MGCGFFSVGVCQNDRVYTVKWVMINLSNMLKINIKIIFFLSALQTALCKIAHPGMGT